MPLSSLFFALNLQGTPTFEIDVQHQEVATTGTYQLLSDVPLDTYEHGQVPLETAPHTDWDVTRYNDMMNSGSRTVQMVQSLLLWLGLPPSVLNNIFHPDCSS